MARRPTLALPLALAVLLLAAAPGQASAPWSEPAAIPGSVDGFPSLTFTSAGAGLAAWTAGGSLGSPPVLSGASSAGAGTFGAARELGRLGRPRVEAYGRDRIVVLGETGTRRPRAVVAFGPATGRLGTPRPLGPRHSRAVALAANPSGDAVALLALCPDLRCRLPVPAIAVRRAGRAFGAPVAIGARQRAFSGTVAINARGDVLVVWERPRRGLFGTRNVYARIRTAGGRLGAARRLGRATPFVALRAAIGDGRRAVVAWLGQAVSEGDALGPATISFAVAAPGASFGPERRLEAVGIRGTGRYVGQAGVDVVIGPDQRPLLAWTGFEGDRFVVRAAAVSGDTAEAAQTVSDPGIDTVLSDLAVGPRGEALVLGLQGIRGADPSGPVSIVAAFRPAGAAAFGALEAVTAPGGSVEAAQGAFDPVGGDAVAVWRDYGSRVIATARRPAAPAAAARARTARR